jgi:phosphoribosyl-ATP pyrophosphohydrolase/phosphoribosyl-AMP cyclohydrolase/histidinol dehydrogenase
VAALAFGVDCISPCDVVVGPGNRWVTAAKKLLLGRIGIDMLAGPSELVVLADATADAELIAADLLAQAEHDPDAVPILLATDQRLPDRVEAALLRQLADLPAGDIANAALAKGFAVVVPDLEQAVALCDRIAPEHLQVLTAHPEQVAERLSSYGALFIGPASAEVLGDYGAGPNHTLPTGGSARFAGGLSVLDFLRVRTWMQIDDPAAAIRLIEDAITLARLEGLEAHARAAERRCRVRGPAGNPSVAWVAVSGGAVGVANR